MYRERSLVRSGQTAGIDVSGTVDHPRVSIGIPVRNGETTLPGTLDSILAQTFANFEVVISDNASDDRTKEICLDYARRDSRVRFYRSASDLGQIANFNRVFELSRGEFFRWMGCNDWLAEEYVQRCVDALTREPSAVLATCYQAHYDGDGRRFYSEYKGPRVDMECPHRRFGRMLWFFRASPLYIDPIYSLIRRSALMQSGLLPPLLGTDIILSCELSLIGPFCHVPECLAFRRVTSPAPRAEILARYDPRQDNPRWWFVRMCRAIAAMAIAKPVSRTQKAFCLWGLAGYFVRSGARRLYAQCRSVVALRTRYRAAKAALRARIGWAFSPTANDTDSSNRES